MELQQRVTLRTWTVLILICYNASKQM